MATFPWRLLGADTLAYFADEAELDPLLSEGFELGGDEAFAIIESGSLVEVVTAATLKTGTGLGWVRKLKTRRADFNVVFVEAGQVEVVRHMLLADSAGDEVRCAVKLRFLINPARTHEFVKLAGGAPLVTTAEVEEALDAEVGIPLAERLAALKASELRENEVLGEELRALVTERVRGLAAAIGIKISGLGLAWGLDGERVGRMAVAAKRHEENAASLAALRAKVSGEREARLAALRAKETASAEALVEVGAAEVKLGAEPMGGSPVSVDGERKDTQANAQTATAVDVRKPANDAEEFLSAPCGGVVEEGPLSSCDFQPNFSPEGKELGVLSGELTEPAPEFAADFEHDSATTHRPADPAHGTESEAPADDSADEGLSTELTSRVVDSTTADALAGMDGVDAKEAGAEPEGMPGRSGDGESATSSSPGESHVSLPPPSLAEKVKFAPGWNVYGDETVACLLDEAEMPRLFRKDLALGGEEALVVVRDGRCEDFIIRGTEKTSGALSWINRLHSGGRNFYVLFLRTDAFRIAVDFRGLDSAAEEVVGVARVLVKVPPLCATGMLPYMKRGRSLGRVDMADILREALQDEFQKALVGEMVSRTGYSVIEHILSRTLQKKFGVMGLDVVDTGFEWATDDEAFKGIERDFCSRSEDAWRFRIERNVLDVRRRIELEARRIENLSALLHLPEQTKPELRKMLVRSSFSVEALKAPQKKPQEIELELRKARAEIAALTDELSMLVETGDAELRSGPPTFEERSAPKLLSQDEDGRYLTEPLGEGEWESDITLGSHGTRMLPTFQASNAGADEGDFAKARNGNPASQKEQSSVRVGGLGAKLTVQTRCVHCMAPLRREANTCGNCGRRI